MVKENNQSYPNSQNIVDGIKNKSMRLSNSKKYELVLASGEDV